MKRCTLSALAAMFAVLAVLCCSCGKANISPDGLYAYTIKNSGAHIAEYLGDKNADTLVLPSVLGNAPVTAVDGGVFAEMTSLISVTLPNTMTEIGASAFYGCAELSSVVFPEKLSSVGASAFYGCAIEALSFDRPVTISDGAFFACEKLRSVSLSRGSVGAYAFSACTKLKTVSLGSIVSLGGGAFDGCTSLSDVSCADGLVSAGAECFANTPFLSDFSGDFLILGKTLLLYGGGELSVTVPDGIVMIADAFRQSAVTEVFLPSSLREVGDMAFAGSLKLRTAAFESGLETIGDRAFSGCQALESVTLPATVSAVAQTSFANCPSLIIHGAADSYTQRFCSEHGLEFSAK